jgi:hypothetical protein
MKKSTSLRVQVEENHYTVTLEQRGSGEEMSLELGSFVDKGGWCVGTVLGREGEFDRDTPELAIQYIMSETYPDITHHLCNMYVEKQKNRVIVGDTFERRADRAKRAGKALDEYRKDLNDRMDKAHQQWKRKARKG